MESKLLKVTNDYVFKRIFGKKGNEDITRSFIEAVTSEYYEDINLEDTPILERDLLENKMGILDVKVVANEINDIDIEMQVTKSEYIAERILWYWAKMYASSIEKGEGYSSTKRAICIMIADFKVERLKEIENYHTKWNIREGEKRDIILTDKLEIHIIELAKLKDKDSKEKLKEWCKFIKAPESVEEATMKENEEIRKAKEELDKISQDKKERRLAELREKAIMDEMAIRDSGYNDGFAEGKKDGLEEGIKEGMKEGIKEGIKEGMKQGVKDGKKIRNIEIAKEMLKENLDLALISKITDLSIDEIKKLK